jgi:hypothetical protein
VREPQHLLLTRPCDRCVEEAGDTDSARQPTIDSSLDEERYRHADVALSTIAVPVSISDSHRRSRAIAVTSLTRASARIGRTAAGDAPSGAMSSRRRRCGVLLHGTVRTDGVVSPFEA